jgi:hypothetical protein
MYVAAVLAAVVLVAVAGYFFFRPREGEGDPLFVCPCPKCKRRLRFKKSRAGKPAMCPRCFHKFTFPMSDEKVKHEEA